MDFGSPEHELALKQFIIAMIVREAQADQDFSILEKRYLSYAAKTLGLSDTDVAAIRLNPKAYEIAPPPNEQERMNVLYYLLFMMRADNNISKEEENMCHHIGFRLGFRREMISDLIDVMRECLDKEIPPNAMLGLIRAYLN
ncbi:MAG: hypothetical protein K9J37_12565 [Saprospiraceae bacterium]|nr:hypothetical protein [Saprospiraceae bacterium]MCF8250744.1 hypothetical protein [Saprospiraceae bacterium]MCF8279801.1 hypothetical protein [Bacteroidales bacterium]MCF8310494.1 hypothetical protein [Saprospiraceae bacterium]MCF8440874.1 hypothetical protein [Saprospiraceae bacterium]